MEGAASCKNLLFHSSLASLAKLCCNSYSTSSIQRSLQDTSAANAGV